MTENTFKIAISNQLDRMISKSTELFYVNMDKDELFTVYLASFPEGTNKLYRKRTVHDCQECKKFIRSAGHIVAMIDGQLESVWDINIPGFEQVVANALSQAVKFKSIAGIYRSREKEVGSKPDKEVEYNEELKKNIINIYEHFYYELPSQFILNDIGKFKGDTTANKKVLETSMTEISLEAADEVLDLIENNQLTKGIEFRPIVEKFIEVKKLYDWVEKSRRDEFLWLQSAKLKEFGRFKNKMIGTLLLDISEGTYIETAVHKYEKMADPRNYKRSKTVVTQKMLDRAELKVEELGITDALKRRFGTIHDVNDYLYADTGKKIKKPKKKGIFANIEPTKLEFDPENMDSMSMDDFIYTILPYIDLLEVMVENKHTNNLVSLVGPEKSRAPGMFKWPNPISWTYNRGVTDSIRQLVEKAGGSVTGYGRISLKWPNTNDLDLHVVEPNGNEIFYGNKRSYTGGRLDVDMNVGEPLVTNPVENITWPIKSDMRPGKYKVFVNNYTDRKNDRDTDEVGFQVEIEINGDIKLFTYDKPLNEKEKVTVIEFTLTENGITDVKSIPSSSTTKEIWGISTHKWTKVSMLMTSPNFWHGQSIGNKHWFFMLENCLNPDQARGFYNEFLINDLKEHRKTFELLSSKMKTPLSDKQLSGVGFSETLENHILVRVSGKFDRVIKIAFAPNKANRFQKPVIVVDVSAIGLCEVCKKDVITHEHNIVCPLCEHPFNKVSCVEWVRTQETCPACREKVPQRLMDQTILLLNK